MAFHDHFSGVAKSYASFRPRYPAALFDWLASLVPGTATVWDCACGSGQAAVDLAERFARVVATDASAEQIAAAVAHPRVEYRVATAEASGLADASVGLVTVAQAAHWFDLARFHAEVQRVLAPGGVLALWAYGVCAVEGAEVDALARHYYGHTLAAYWPPERVLVEQGYRTLAFPFVEIAAPAMQLEARWTLEELLGYFSTWSATNRCVAATGSNPLEALAAEMRRVWGEGARRVVWPLALRVGRKE